MGAQKNIACYCLPDQVGRFSLSSWIFVRPGVGERPAVKASLLDGGEIVGDQIISERVSLLDCSPERVGPRTPAQADRVSRSGGEHFVPAPIRIVSIDRGAPGI